MKSYNKREGAKPIDYMPYCGRVKQSQLNDSASQLYTKSAVQLSILRLHNGFIMPVIFETQKPSWHDTPPHIAQVHVNIIGHAWHEKEKENRL